MTQEQELLKEALYVLNNIPNHDNVCMDGSSSYDLASRIDEVMKDLIREQNFLDNPDEVVRIDYEGIQYTFRDVLNLALGNLKYAMRLIYDEGEDPIEEVIARDLDYKNIICFKNTFKILK